MINLKIFLVYKDLVVESFLYFIYLIYKKMNIKSFLNVNYRMNIKISYYEIMLW